MPSEQVKFGEHFIMHLRSRPLQCIHALPLVGISGYCKCSHLIILVNGRHALSVSGAGDLQAIVVLLPVLY